MDFLNICENKKTEIIFIGQAGFIIKSSNGQLLAIDPYLSDCVERIEHDHDGYKRLLPKLFCPSELKFDVLICTHFHRDHFDIDSVSILMNNPKTFLMCPSDCLNDVKDFDSRRVTIISPGTNIEIGDFNIHFVNCDHGTSAPEAVGVIIEVDDKRILEVGDTCLRLDRKDEYLSFGIIDVLIAPINGAYGNMSECDCAKLSNVLNPNLTIPCHYGMFADHGGNPGLFIKEMRIKCPRNKFYLMRLGETLDL